jgi:hypothetical protein
MGKVKKKSHNAGTWEGATNAKINFMKPFKDEMEKTKA